MRTESTYFYSDHLKLDAAFYSPDDERKPLAYVIVCSGFQGLNNIHPARYARALTTMGYRCFGFDYRGFAKSQGKMGEVLLEDQVRDIANAVRFVGYRAKKEKAKVFLAGWGMGAGLVLKAAQITPVDGLVSINGFYNAMRVQKALRTTAELQEFLSWLNEERTREICTGEYQQVDPFKIYPLDKVTTGYVDGVLRKNPDFGNYVFTSFADSLLAFDVEKKLENLQHTPILIAHGDQNALHPVQEAKSLYEEYLGLKELYWINNAGHTEWMYDDHPNFIQLTKKIDQWIQKIL